MNMNVVRNNSSKRINIINMHAYDKLVAFSDSSMADSSSALKTTLVNILILVILDVTRLDLEISLDHYALLPVM